MTTVNVTEQSNVAKYLVINQQKDPSTLITTRVIITDNANNNIKLIDLQRGPEGPMGPQGPAGIPGRDGASFDILPITSGGTNNSIFVNDKIIYYDGNKLASTNYTIDDILSSNGSNAITGIIEGIGISKIVNGSSVTLNTNLGDGLGVNSANQIVVDDTIARRVELTVGNISGILGIGKGGTNNNIFTNNRLVYFDGNKLSSFPLDTGRIVTSGSTINVIAGSGLTGGGLLSLPSGSVVLNIGSSDDIFVAENLIELSNTGLPGTYTKIITDIKGRVVSGLSLSNEDIITALGYVPWHPNNDGAGSNLDADLLDGRQGSYYLNYSNLTGTMPTSALPDITVPGTYSKVTVNSKGLVLNSTNINYNDVVTALGYRPVSTNGDSIIGDLNVDGNLLFKDGELKLEDNLPIFSYNNSNLLPNDPRGFSFVYGNSFRQTGILAYYPADNQLKLITRIFGSGDNDIGGGDSATDLFNGEVDGGDSDTIFLLGNIQGDQAIVLLQHIADARYMRTTTDQIISGIKTFINPINVYNKINIIETASYSGPPLDVGNNVGLNINLNSDLLDNEHGSFYRDAFNLTGILDYNDTVVTNLDGTVGQIPKFDSRTSEPSRTISDSIIRQSGDSNIFVDDGSVSVGDNKIDEIKSLAVGSQNEITSQNSLAVGRNNIVNAENGVAFNLGSKVNNANSVAMGDHGTTWAANQLAFGAFEELSPVNNSTRVGLGQHTLTAIGYYGTAADYMDLSPILTIPNNKTVLYNIDLIFTKFAGEAAAAFSFHSGIIKNYEETTTILKDPIKTEIYNDSQIRDYFYTIVVGEDNKNQVLSVRTPPLQNNNFSIQNVNSAYRIKPDLTEISGYFVQTFDGQMLLKMNKPVSSGTFEQIGNLSTVKIRCENHGVVLGSIVDLNFTSGTQAVPPASGYRTILILNDDEFIIDNPWFDSSYANNSGHLQIVRKRTNQAEYERFLAEFPYYNCTYVQNPFDNSLRQIHLTTTGNIVYAPNYEPYIKFETAVNVFSGVLTSGSNIISQCNPPQAGKIVAGMLLYSDVPGFPYANEVAVSPVGDTIQMLSSFTGSTNTGLIVYSGMLPPNGNYAKQDTGPASLLAEKLDSGTSGFFVSGEAKLYSTSGVANININLEPFDNNVNIQSGEFCYLNFLTTKAGVTKPVSDNYFMINTEVSKINVVSHHLMPDSGISNTGLVTVTFNRDHGFLPVGRRPNLLQQIPLSFSLPQKYSLINFTERDNPLNRKPNDSIYTIAGVTGDYILTSTSGNLKNVLLREPGKPPVYDRFITSDCRIGSDFYYLSVGFVNNYFQIDDEIKCLFSISGQPTPQYNQNFRITHIDNKKNTYRIVPSTGDIYALCSSMAATGIGSDAENPAQTGVATVSYIGLCSGFVYSPINNIYFHSYGGRTESWGRDYTGRYIDPPQTGFFTVCNNNNNTCVSGTTCIKISGISDFTNISTGDEFYFDFVDLSGFNLRDRFVVHDKLSPNILTINVPRHPHYMDQSCFINEYESGLVYLIDSMENIKTNKNPNYNNIFLSSLIQTRNDSIYQYKLSTYNDFNNRWKHCVSLYNTIQPNNYEEKFSVSCDGLDASSSDVKLIVLTPYKIQSSLSYSIDPPHVSYTNISENENIVIPRKSHLKLKILVSNGAGNWSGSATSTQAIPRINIIGLTDYQIQPDANDLFFDTATQKWNITVNCHIIDKLMNNHNVKIIVSDESGRTENNFTISTFQPLTVAQIENTVHGYTMVDGAGTTWEMLLDVYGGALSTTIAPFIVTALDTSRGFPSNTVFVEKSFLNNKPENWWTIKLYGPAGSEVKVFSPEIGINDGQNTIMTTGTIIVKPNDTTDIKEYEISLRRFVPHVINNYTNINYGNFYCSFPVIDGNSSEFNPVFEWYNKSSLSILGSYSYDPDIKIYSYQATISGDPGYYTPKLKIKINQPFGGGNKEYTFETDVQVTLFNKLEIDLGSIPGTIQFDKDKLWAFDFFVSQGASAYRSDLPPKVYIGNTPNIGVYDFSDPTPLEYTISKTYSTADKYWKISVTGKSDQFGGFAVSTGLYPVNIYAEDYSSYDYELLNVKINDVFFLKNINANKYATPNNAFEFNVDVAGGVWSGVPSINFSSKDTALTSINSPNYRKYDPSVKIWEANFKSANLVDKWDSIIELAQNQDSLIVKAKGISSDKLYVAGRVSAVETDNLNELLKPLSIINLNTQDNPYEVDAGSAWAFSFQTTGGLEDPMYPPKIEFTGGSLPTSCDGYDIDLPLSQCVAQTPQWNDTNKTWKYSFSGDPRCFADREFPDIIVKATDKKGNQSDTKTTKIVYKSLPKMPNPTVGSPDDTSLLPNCQEYKSAPFPYKIGTRDICPRLTGISGIITSGSLPPGIVMIDTKQGYWKAPYSDLSSGTIFFSGFPTQFANGTTYPDKFYITAVDGRGYISDKNEITFTDASRAIYSSPTDITIYFATSGYQYTPRKTSSGSSVFASGTKIIDNQTTKMLRPPAVPASMQCLSVLPHNNCMYSTGIYTAKDSNTIKITGPGTAENIPQNPKREIKNAKKIYVEFNDRSDLNGQYEATREGDDISITRINHGIDSQHTGLLGLLNINNNLIDETVNGACYAGNPQTMIDPMTAEGLLGSGLLIEEEGIKGIRGLLRPTRIAKIVDSQPYPENSEHLENFVIDDLFPADWNVDDIYSVKFSSHCYETGYLRFSGVILPPFSIDSVDPPPGTENNIQLTYTTINNGPIGVAMRSSYGTGSVQRNNSANLRSCKVNCKVIDLITNEILQSEQKDTTEGVGSFFIPPSTFNKVARGSVLKVSFETDGDVFPTYKRESKPATATGYYWVHKGFPNATNTLQPDTFPPVIPVESKTQKLIFTTGIDNSADILFVGGFIPQVGGSFSYTGFPPHVTGYLQHKMPNTQITGLYEQQAQSGHIDILLPNVNLNIGNSIKIKFNTETGQLLDNPITGIVVQNKISDNIIRINNVPIINTLSSGTVDITDLFKFTLDDNPNPYQIKLSHRSGALDYPSFNSNIDLVKFNSETGVFKKSILMNIFPQPYQLSIISGTHTESFVGVNGFVFSGTLTNGSDTITNCSPSPINKLDLGVQLYSPTHSLPNPHSISSITSDTVTLSSNYIGDNADNVMFYFEGYQLTNLYDNMVDIGGTGLFEMRRNIFDNNGQPMMAFKGNIQLDGAEPITISPIGQSTYTVTGMPNNPGLYNFAVITSENSGLLTNSFCTESSDPSLNIKRHMEDFETMIVEPLKIIPTTSSNVILSNESWSFSFIVSGGYIPRSQDFVVIELNNRIHTFNRYENILSNNSMIVTIQSKPMGTNYWAEQFNNPNGLLIRAYDSVSMTTHNIYRQT